MVRLVLLTVLVGCSSDSPGGDVVGPFTGDVHRYVIDSFTLPRSGAEQDAMGDDLDGDGAVDNQLGTVLTVLASSEDVTSHSADMIASGVLASAIEIQADDLDDDARVGLRYFGTAADDPTVVGGKFVGGAFRANRARTTAVPGQALARVPVFTDADPAVLELDGLEIDLEPDGQGGYVGLVRGAVPIALARSAAFEGMTSMILANPSGHLPFARLLDTDGDGVISRPEFDNQSVLTALLAADVRLFANGVYQAGPGEGDSMSLGFKIHLSPCAAGQCTTTAPMQCHDRTRTGDETAIDCGGPCKPCPSGAPCAVAADCQSNACDGHCGAASCSDTVRDGFESDIDCGANCARCAIGKQCAQDSDCASGNCDAAVAASGTCRP